MVIVTDGDGALGDKEGLDSLPSFQNPAFYRRGRKSTTM